jgi:hypothetical protein
MIHKSTSTPSDIATLSERAAERLWGWWDVDLTDLMVEMDSGDIYPAGDSSINPCLEKEHGHYDGVMPLLSISQLIQYLDDHDLYQDPATGMTHADGIAADQLCDFLWDRVKAHLEYGENPAPLPDSVLMPA